MNEAVRTRQYREVIDAEKNISRQIYNLYQRQEAAYNEGIPSIRNQNQLAPIAGVIEAVSAFQTELQNLMNSAANSYFQFSANNFVPVVKTFNSLVFALRSIQNIYKRDVQIKYEVDKLLKPVIDLIQSLASQLAYDPAVSNRLFQMKTNLQSKVYERIDYNVGKRTIKQIDGENPTVQTFQPGSEEKMDTFQQPIQYDPESNDPFLGRERLKPEVPATFEGLDVAGFDLTDADRAALKDWVDTTKAIEADLLDFSTPIRENLPEELGSMYGSLEPKLLNVLEANNFGSQKIEQIKTLYNLKQEGIEEEKERRRKEQLERRRAKYRQKRKAKKEKKQQKAGEEEQDEFEDDSVSATPSPVFRRSALVRTPSVSVSSQRITRQKKTPLLSLAADFSPQLDAESSYTSSPPSPGSRPKQIPEMNKEELQRMLRSGTFGSKVYTQQLKNDLFFGKTSNWDAWTSILKKMYKEDPTRLVNYLNETYGTSFPSPSQPISSAASASASARRRRRKQGALTPVAVMRELN
jgi:hypothetical protein